MHKIGTSLRKCTRGNIPGEDIHIMYVEDEAVTPYVYVFDLLAGMT